MGKTLSRMTFDALSDTAAPREADDSPSLRVSIAIWILASIAGWAVVVAAVSAIV